MSGRGGSGGGFAAAFGLLLVVGLIIKYIWWILGALGLVVAVWLAVVIGREVARHRREAEKRRRNQHARLSRQADRQHAWVLEGDARGVYGEEGAEYMRYIERNNWDGLLRKIQQPRW
jgi:hypothetical protein